MESDVLKAAASQGIWAVLSVTLIFYILRSQEKRDQLQAAREEKYQTLISTLTGKLDVIEEIKTDISMIKSKVI